MKVIIAGGRDFHEYATVVKAVELSGFRITTVVSGGAKGADALGERYADEMNLALNVYEADWVKNGRAAGPIRNRLMAENAEALIALWDGKSRGTKNMIETATKKGLLVYVMNYTEAKPEPTDKWTEQDKEAYRKALGQVFGWK
jgi:hypothetical protein